MAPHRGALVELGDHFANLELVYDRTVGRLTIYVLDAHAENTIRISQPALRIHLDGEGGVAAAAIELRAVANPLTGETVGDSSQFGVTMPELVGRPLPAGRLEQVSLRGREFRDVQLPAIP